MSLELRIFTTPKELGSAAAKAVAENIHATLERQARFSPVLPAHVWYEGFWLSRERERGLEFLEDALHVATATIELAPHEEFALFLTAEEDEVDFDSGFHPRT